MHAKIDLTDVTFLFAVRIDSVERVENIRAVVTYLSRCCDTTILLMEADAERSGLLAQYLPDSVDALFTEDHDETFNKVKSVNKLVRKVQTPYVAVWDADVIVQPAQLYRSVKQLRTKQVAFSYPYDGRFLDTGIQNRIAFINSYDIRFLEKRSDKMRLPYTSNACGGAFFAHRETYIVAGLENENLKGWGPDDGERLTRWRTLQLKIGRVKGPMFHLSHPRGMNSQFRSEDHKDSFYGEIERIKQMSKSELIQEIRTWGS